MKWTVTLTPAPQGHNVVDRRPLRTPATFNRAYTPPSSLNPLEPKKFLWFIIQLKQVLAQREAAERVMSIPSPLIRPTLSERCYRVAASSGLYFQYQYAFVGGGRRTPGAGRPVKISRGRDKECHPKSISECYGKVLIMRRNVLSFSWSTFQSGLCLLRGVVIPVTSASSGARRGARQIT